MNEHYTSGTVCCESQTDGYENSNVEKESGYVSVNDISILHGRGTVQRFIKELDLVSYVDNVNDIAYYIQSGSV